MTATATAPRVARAAKFGIVGIVGLAINLVVQAAIVRVLGVNYLVAAILATQVSSTANFLMAESWVFGAGAMPSGRARRYLAFMGMNNAALLLRAPIMWVLTSRFGLHYTLSNFASLAAMTLIRFGIADAVIWRPPTGTHFRTTAIPVAEPLRLLPRPLAVQPLPPRSRRLGLAVVAVCAAATVLRLTDLTAVGLNSDEAVYSGQGAAMFRVGHAAQYFSLFRAHPLLLQSVVGAVFRMFGQSDFAARFVVAMVFGVGSVALTYLLGRLVSSAGAALIAAATCALLPYHVIVSRQVLVDTAMGFFAVLSLVLVLRWMRTLSPTALIGAFAAAGLATISKEVAVLVVPVLYYAVWHDGGWRAWLKPPVVWATAVYALIVLPFPLTRLVSQSHNASSFFLWQFNRAPNHQPDWFGRVLLQYVTPAVLILVVIGVVALVARRQPVDRVLLAYVGLFAFFFSAWPTKLFPYLYLLIPALCVFAAIGVVTAVTKLGRGVGSPLPSRLLGGLVVVSMLVFLTAISWRAVTTTADKDIPGVADFDVEVQSFAGTREFAEWARSTPTNARFLTVGPSLGNILRFYGNRDSVAMSVSVDPTKRNPAYVPVPNPDLSLRQLQVQYVVWDAYSADRSSFYSERTLRYARKFDGVIVFSAYTDGHGHLEITKGPPPEGIRARILVYSIDGGPLPVEGKTAGADT
jgi:4-amino-4-deoxy-L-arabinose transferase-like glycosyltransferase/putative flippase GtrA